MRSLSLAASLSGQYPPKLHNYLMKTLRNADDAREVAQEAYLCYLKTNPQGVHRFDRYIFRIALRLAQKVLSRREMVLKSSTGFDLIAGWVGGSVEDAAEPEIKNDRLQKILDAIPAKYRRVLWMMKVEEKSYTQVAQELGLSPKTVLVYLSRAVLAARQVDTDAEQDGG